MKNGFVRGQRLYPAHYALLYFTKGAPSAFNRPRLSPQRCRHCDGFVKDYGGYTPIIVEKGINLSDFWDDISPVRHAKNKNRGANELPPLITDRVMAIAGQPGGVLVDPFVGTGTTLVSAVTAGMTFVANDMVRSNLETCSARLRRLRAIDSSGAHSKNQKASDDGDRYAARNSKRRPDETTVHKNAHARSITRIGLRVIP
jgi:site-specific DNA-methyltransferase (adenine-specific)